MNHYYCKSLEYYINKKIPGGDVDKITNKYTLDDFFKRDISGTTKDFAVFKYLIRLKTFNIDDYIS